MNYFLSKASGVCFLFLLSITSVWAATHLVDPAKVSVSCTYFHATIRIDLIQIYDHYVFNGCSDVVADWNSTLYAASNERRKVLIYPDAWTYRGIISVSNEPIEAN